MACLPAPCAVLGALAAGFVSLFAADVGHAQTLNEALGQAYLTNPALQGARADLRAVDEGVPTALAGWRPKASVAAGGGYINSFSNNDSNSNSNGNTTFSTTDGPAVVLQFQFRQPIYDFYTGANVDRAKQLVEAQQAQLSAAEQNVLLQAVDAYMAVLRAQELRQSRISYLQTLDRNVDSARRLRERGVIGEGALAEAISQRAAASADVTQADGGLATARDQYAEVIGSAPTDLRLPDLPPGLPASQDETVALSAGVPGIAAAKYAEMAAKSGVDASSGVRLPRFDLQSTVDAQTAAVYGLMTVPLYDGALDPRLRQSKQQAIKARYDLEAQYRQARSAAISAWQAFESARAQIPAITEQVRAADIASQSARREGVLGLRTMSDLLTIESRSEQAQVNLLTAQTNLRTAAYRLLAAIGRLTARDLGLDVPFYNDQAYYEENKDKWFGTGPDIK